MVEKAFKGLRPAVVALIAVPVLQQPVPPVCAAGAGHSRGCCAIHMVARLSPVYIIIVAAAGGLYYRMY
jgi:chromate transporter